MPIAQDTRYGPFATLLAPDDQELGRTLTGPGFELAEPVHALGDCPKVFDPGYTRKLPGTSSRRKLPQTYFSVFASISFLAQQRRFDRFCNEFNLERPHEALQMQTPASLYTASPRPMPDKLPPIEYPDHFEVRYVSANGGIRWNCQWVNVSVTCVGEYVGLEEIDDGIWNVVFRPAEAWTAA